MGIVVAVFMLVGLLMASPWVPTGTRRLRSSPNMVDGLASGMPLVIALGLCFGLYAFALVRLNLGLSIPG